MKAVRPPSPMASSTLQRRIVSPSWASATACSCLGGKVEKAPNGGEFGSMPIRIEPGSVLFSEETADEQTVWMSHGDDATELPDGFRCVATSTQGCRVAIEDRKRKFFGLQYHPEVVHSKRGLATLKHFLTGIAGARIWLASRLSAHPRLAARFADAECGAMHEVHRWSRSPALPARSAFRTRGSHMSVGRMHEQIVLWPLCMRLPVFHGAAGLESDWSMESVIEAEKEVIRTRIGRSEHVICALSGGVDSTVAATLVHQVIGDRLHCVFVDNGLLRYEEGSRVMTMFKQKLHLPVTKVGVLLS
jgi:hypothetical protein